LAWALTQLNKANPQPRYGFLPLKISTSYRISHVERLLRLADAHPGPGTSQKRAGQSHFSTLGVLPRLPPESSSCSILTLENRQGTVLGSSMTVGSFHRVRSSTHWKGIWQPCQISSRHRFVSLARRPKQAQITIPNDEIFERLESKLPQILLHLQYMDMYLRTRLHAPASNVS
jgi:hypothetical protein